MTVYLIHLDTPIPQGPHPKTGKPRYAKHYLGYCHDLSARIEQHRNGTGARLLQVANERGIGWRVVRTWEGDRKLERKLKDERNSPRLCPVCHPELKV